MAAGSGQAAPVRRAVMAVPRPGGAPRARVQPLLPSAPAH